MPDKDHLFTWRSSNADDNDDVELRTDHLQRIYRIAVYGVMESSYHISSFAVNDDAPSTLLLLLLLVLDVVFGRVYGACSIIRPMVDLLHSTMES